MIVDWIDVESIAGCDAILVCHNIERMSYTDAMLDDLKMNSTINN